ncbi:MAG: aspartate/glutamate racemase family protein, partial [Ignavibacteriaceae bacterium]|nr:aspartate/glutamate racemase family protein [Ignavibacteriaceae bacterium]
LSVAASISNNFKHYSNAEKVKIVFFNSLAHPDYGYNRMPGMQQKSEVFDSALRSIELNYSPDIILIACNTLSVVFPSTRFSKYSNIPVIGIVEFGINLMAEKLNEDKHASVIILGTETTIKAGSHKNGLIALGINEDRIITQSCKNLESVIQTDPNSKETGLLIEKYIDQALIKYPRNGGVVYVALCCTHYGYSIPIFNKVLSKKDIEYSIINPNESMSDFFLTGEKTTSGGKCEIGATVVSMCAIKNLDMKNIGRCINNISPDFYEALKTYEHNSTLFEVNLRF